MKNYMPSVLLFLSLSPLHAGATTVTYQLDQNAARGLSQSGALTITLDDEGAPGAINFSIELLDDSLVSKRGVGIKAVAFNGPQLSTTNIQGLSGWRIKNDRAAGSVGKFSNVITGRSGGGNLSMSFSIAGKTGDLIEDYIASSTNGYLFAVSISGLGNSRSVRSAWFPVSGAHQLQAIALPEPSIASVPLPASVWLLASGLLGVVGIARRKVEPTQMQIAA